MSQNLALIRFELHVGHPHDLTSVLSPLRKTLSSISSPVFSEFTLKLGSSPMKIRFFHLLSGEGALGDEWGLIDRDLHNMVHAVGRDIRLVFRVGAGGEVWSSRLGELVGDVFPLMKARGLVSVEVGP